MRPVLVLAATLALAGPLALAHGATHARQALLRDSPATVQGRGFRSHEPVRVVIVMDARRWSRSVTASTAGGFTAVFPGVRIDTCALPLQISARGSRTGRVVAVLPVRDCAAP